MFLGIPPVVFPHGGIKTLVVDDFTGLVVRTETEYQQAIEFLYRDPEERRRLGDNAVEYATQMFGGENAARSFNRYYEKVMQMPKRKRTWGMDSSKSLLEQEINEIHLRGDPKRLSGAERFIDSIGEQGGMFSRSLKASNVKMLFPPTEK